MMEEQEFKRTERVLIHEIRRGDAIVEIYEIQGREKTCFDIRTTRAYLNQEGAESRGAYLQQRDLRHLQIAIVEAEIWISQKHRELRG